MPGVVVNLDFGSRELIKRGPTLLRADVYKTRISHLLFLFCLLILLYNAWFQEPRKTDLRAPREPRYIIIYIMPFIRFF